MAHIMEKETAEVCDDIYEIVLGEIGVLLL